MRTMSCVRVCYAFYLIHGVSLPLLLLLRLLRTREFYKGNNNKKNTQVRSV
jgi:hypothetical protein